METPAHQNYSKLIIALLIAEICSALELTMVYVAMPAIVRQFGASGSGWVVTACLLTSAASAALCGRLGDLYGRRGMLAIVTLVCTIGSFTSALSPVLSGVIIGAGLQGVSGAIFALCLALVREHLPADRVPLMTGIVLASATASAALGLVIGGVLIDSFGWQSIFWLSGCWGTISLCATLLMVPRSSLAPQIAAGIDMIRGILFVPAIAIILLGLTLIKASTITDPEALATLSFGLLLMAYWVRHQLGQETPLIQLRMLADPQIAIACFCMALIGMSMMQHTLLMAMLLQQRPLGQYGFGLSAGLAGLLMMPVRLIGIVTSPLSGRISGSWGPRSALLIGCGLSLAGWSLILIATTNLPAVVIGMILEGAGFAFVYVAVPIILMNAAPSGRTGEIVGLSSVIRATFTAIGAQILMLIIDAASRPVPGTIVRGPGALSYDLAIGFILASCLVCTWAAYRLPKARGITIVH